MGQPLQLPLVVAVGAPHVPLSETETAGVVLARFSRPRKLATYQALFPGQAFTALPGYAPPIPWDHPDPAEVDGDFLRLVESGALASIDSAQVYGAVMVELSRNRRPGRDVRANDAYDVLRTATMIPAVDFYTTEQLAKTMLERSGVADEYSVEVFGGSRSEMERFRDAFSQRIETGPGAG